MLHITFAHKLCKVAHITYVTHVTSIKMDSRIMKQIVKIDEVERMQKRIEEEAELNLSIQKDIESERKLRRERQRKWILGLPGGSLE